jgi:hypothetical protein
LVQTAKDTAIPGHLLPGFFAFLLINKKACRLLPATGNERLKQQAFSGLPVHIHLTSAYIS